MIKKAVFGLTVAVMVTIGGAALFGQNAADFKYRASNGEVTITGYTGSAKDVAIPDRIDGLPVTAIGHFAFWTKQLTSVTIPDSVTAIGVGAFKENKLARVAIPNSVTRIGDYAFSYNALTSVTIPDGVTSIGTYAFWENQLVGVTIPGSVKTIGRYAFQYNQLASVTISDSVTRIGYHAFGYNPLASVTLPANFKILAPFPGGLKSVYRREDRQAGTYVADNNGRKWNLDSEGGGAEAGNVEAGNWDISTLDTAREADYLSSVEKDVILEMNKVRADPKKYAELYIKPMLQYDWGGPFGENSYLAPGKTVYTKTEEGRNAIQSCIDDLSGRQGMSPLLPAKGLFLAAKDHADDTGPKGLTGHTGTDGSSMGERINRYGKWSGGAGENISYGSSTGRDIVVQLLVDDGVPGRGHRDNILNKDFGYAAGAIGSHTGYTYLCVIDYANGYTDK
jgi:hypothetical protein